MLNKGKVIDRQLTGQSPTPFMKLMIRKIRRLYHLMQGITIGKEIDCLVEKEIILVIKVMDVVGVIFEEVVFKLEIVVILEEIIVGIEIERTRGLGDNQD